MGPYQATGSSSCFPETSRKRIPSSPACTVTSSPRSKSMSDRMTCRLHRKSLSLAGRNRHIEIDRIRGDAVHRAGLPPEIAADDSHVSAVVIREIRYLTSLHFLITW